MTETDSIRDRMQEHLDRLTACLQEPGWMRRLRLAALETYRQLSVEEAEPVRWSKHLSRPGLDLFADADCSLAPTDGIGCSEEFELERRFRQEEDSRLLFVNGRKRIHYISTELARHGILFTDLSLAVRMFPNLVQRYFGEALPANANRWAALQTALWTEGLFLYVPRGVKAKFPLQAWWNRSAAGAGLHPRLLIVAREGSDVTLLTGEASALEAPALSLGLTEIIAEKNARVRLASLHDNAAPMTRLHLCRAVLQRDARVEALIADAGEGCSLVDAEAELRGENAFADLRAVGLGSRDAKLDFTLTAHHKGRRSESRLTSHAIVADRARADYRSVSRIDGGAVKSNSIQEERLLLLDRTAHAHAVPTLLIEEEDVKCDHALSVGQLSADQLFYLQSRGLTEGEAKRLLLRGFLAPLAENLPVAGLREVLDEWIDRKIKT